MAHLFVLTADVEETKDILERTPVTVLVTLTGLPDGLTEVKISGERVAVEIAADLLDEDPTEIDEV